MSRTLRLSASTVLLALSTAAGGPAQDRPPTRRETTELVQEYLQIDGRTRDGRQQQRAVLERLALVPALRPHEIRSWRGKLEKEQRKLRRLETDSRNHWWPEEERGLYLVGGETRKPRGLLISMHGGGVGSGDAGSASLYKRATANRTWAATPAAKQSVRSTGMPAV